MTTSKNHDEHYLGEDARRLGVTAVLVLVGMLALAFVEHHHHLIGRLIVVPQQSVVTPQLVPDEGAPSAE